MAKNRLLVASRTTALIFLTLSLFVACTLPRIIVLRDPLTPEERINLGVSYEKNGKLEEALAEYGKASERLPIAWLYMGNVHFQQKNYDEAQKTYQRAIEGTGDARAYNNLAWLYYTKGTNLDEAKKLAEKAVELEPEKADFKDTLKKIAEQKAGYRRECDCP